MHASRLSSADMVRVALEDQAPMALHGRALYSKDVVLTLLTDSRQGTR